MIKAVLPLVLLLLFYRGTAQELPQWKATDMVSYIKDSKGSKVKVINVWATFCKPCIAEIPGFIEVTKKYGSDVELMLISVDLKSHYPEKIIQFSEAHKFTAKMAWLNETNADYFCPILDKSWTGSIPATLVVNTITGYRKFVEDEMSAAQLEEEIKLALGK